MARTEADEKRAEYHRLESSRATSVIRAWFVAFGAGGLVIVLSNKTITTALTKKHYLLCVCILFFSVALFQIIVGILSKRLHQHWEEIFSEWHDEETRNTRAEWFKIYYPGWVRVAHALNSMYVDFFTLGLLAAAGILIAISLMPVVP